MDIRLQRVVTSPRLIQSLRVYRKTGKFAKGGWTETTTSPAYFDIRGIAYPATEKELKQVPEADRPTAAYAFFTNAQLLVTNSDTPGDSDEVQINGIGDKYKIISSLPFDAHWGYLSIGTRVKGD
jgi:hypothetical protein